MSSLLSPLTVALVLTALVTAAISGVSGLAGGTVLVAVMFSVGLEPSAAIPIHAAVQMVSNGSRTAVFARHVHLPSLGLYLLTAIPAPFVVGPWVTRIDPQWARLVMGAFILAVTWGEALKRFKLHSAAGMLVAGALAGGFGMVVGATGTVIAPFFLRDDWSKERVIGTKALCQAAAHLLKIVAFSSYGFAFGKHLALVVPMAFAVVVGTVAGKRLGSGIGERTFKLIYRGLLTVLSLKLIVSAAWVLARR